MSRTDHAITWIFAGSTALGIGLLTIIILTLLDK